MHYKTLNATCIIVWAKWILISDRGLWQRKKYLEKQHRARPCHLTSPIPQMVLDDAPVPVYQISAQLSNARLSYSDSSVWLGLYFRSPHSCSKFEINILEIWDILKFEINCVTFVGSSAMRADFSTKFYTTGKQENVHFSTLKYQATSIAEYF